LLQPWITKYEVTTLKEFANSFRVVHGLKNEFPRVGATLG
jgi:hypothetical protein